MYACDVALSVLLLVGTFSCVYEFVCFCSQVPVCSNLTDMYQRADSDASVSLLAKIGVVDICTSSPEIALFFSLFAW